MMDFYIQVESPGGLKLGGGPITSAEGWRYTARMDRAGEFSFSMPASDPKAVFVQRKNIVRAFALLDSTWTEVGAGIIDSTVRTPGADGITQLAVSGPDLLGELTYRSVLNLRIYDSNAPITHSAAVSAVGAFAPAGWTFTPAASPPNNSLYGRFNGHTVLAALIKIAEKSQTHFFRESGKTIRFASQFTASGVRAIRSEGDLAPETAAITDIKEQIDVADLITRIYPRGSGNADVQLTLRPTNRTAPSGFTLDKTANFIRNDNAVTTYGRIERQVDFREIGPIENTSADLQAAANMLFDAALEELRRRSTELEQATYTLQLDQCAQLLRPMQSIIVDYNDPDTGMIVKATLNILEATWQVDAQGIQTTDLIVSNADRWPDSDTGAVVDVVEQGQLYQALPQLNANSYTTGYRFNLDSQEVGQISFDFGSEVVQLQRVSLKFRLLRFESTIKAVGSETGGASDLTTGGPSVNTTGSGGVLTTGTGGPTATDTGGPTTTGGTSGETGGAGAGDTGGTAPSTGGTAPNTGGTAPNTGDGGGANTGGAGGADTGGSGTLESSGVSGTTGETGLITHLNTDGHATESGGSGNTGDTALSTGGPQGGDIIEDGKHSHGVGVGAYTGSGGHLVRLIPSGSTSQFQAEGATGTVPVNISGNHIHGISAHIHGIDPHNHAIETHDHSIPVHNHTIVSHTHTLTTHTHTIGGHTHTTSSHTHTTASHTHTTTSHTHTTTSHTHTTTAHTHTIGSHTHTVTTHAHTIAQHTHSLSQHTHSLSNHQHDLSDAIHVLYGIFREDAAKTYGINELECRINSGSWAALNTATNQGGGWFRLDITNSVMNADTFRPNQENNTLDIRASAGSTIIEILGTPPIIGIDTIPIGAPASVGDKIIVSNTVHFNGIYIVDVVDLVTIPGHAIYLMTDSSKPAEQEFTGNVQQFKTVTIDALLNVRNIIQSVALL